LIVRSQRAEWIWRSCCKLSRGCRMLDDYRRSRLFASYCH